MPSSMLRSPRQHWLRRALFQVHLWTGAGVGIYLFIIGLSGALLVFRPELQARAYPQFFDIPADGRAQADPAVVIENIRSRYPEYRFSGIDFPTSRRDSFLAYIARGDELKTVFADPHSGQIIGELPEDGWLRRLQELHFNLWLGRPGIPINGIGAACLFVMCLSGLVIWWPGAIGWTRALVVDVSKGWKRVNWELHGATGFWMAAFLMIWAVSGFYFSFPLEFRAALSRVSPLSSPAVTSTSNPARAADFPVPQPAAILQIATSAVPGAQPARYVMATTERAPILVVLARDVHGDWDNSDEVNLYFDQYSGAMLGIRENVRVSAGDSVLAWMGPLHVGSFGGLPIKILWALFGLSLPLLFLTAATMWWNRVLLDWWRRARAATLTTKAS